ncbi:HNH endonuclease [Lysinibacillus sp. LZ02]|uniref:HNH endonuclease n=1 Tax=Lysinibacillus sp. LZ02 TaxID=3420668 RepID=UPI003D35F48C
MLTPERLQWLRKLITEDKVIRFYQWCEWRKLRKKALERDRYECQQCKHNGRYSKAENVHHLKEVKDYPELAMTLSNLESVCITCHNKEHKRFAKVNQPRFINEERW